MHNLYLLARTMIIKRYWRSSTYVVVCAIASDNAIKISNPTESFKIQTKAVVWPAKIKVIQDYNVRLNKKKLYKMWGARIQWHWVRTYPYWLSKFQKIKNPQYLKVRWSQNGFMKSPICQKMTQKFEGFDFYPMYIL